MWATASQNVPYEGQGAQLQLATASLLAEEGVGIGVVLWRWRDPSLGRHSTGFPHWCSMSIVHPHVHRVAGGSTAITVVLWGWPHRGCSSTLAPSISRGARPLVRLERRSRTGAHPHADPKSDLDRHETDGG